MTQLRRICRAAIVGAVALMFATAARGQICTGQSAFRSTPLRAVASVELPSHGRVLGVGLGVGAETGAFGTLMYSHTSASDANVGGNALDGGQINLGYDVQPIAHGGLHLCPIAGFDYESASFQQIPSGGSIQSFGANEETFTAGGSAGGTGGQASGSWGAVVAIKLGK